MAATSEENAGRVVEPVRDSTAAGAAIRATLDGASPAAVRPLLSRLALRLEALIARPANAARARRTRARRERAAAGMLESRRLFGYREALLPNARLAEVDRRARHPLDAVETSGFTIGYPAWNLLYYAALCALPRANREAVVVETGTNRGFSTIVLAQALADAGVAGSVDTVDIDAAVVAIARDNVAQAGLSHRVRFHVGDSIAFLHRLASERPGVDFAFLDGSHEYGHVRAEFAILFPAVVAARGIVYFDNTAAGGVARALHFVRRAYPGNLVEFPNCSWYPPGNAVWQPH
ncbi:MAG: O-methyltransferase [Candidatus Binatia bacterium]